MYGMKRVLWTSCIAALVQPVLAAQGLPDFSGVWTMDLSRSESAAQGPDIGPVTVAIQQTSAEVRIDTTRRHDGNGEIPACRDETRES